MNLTGTLKTWILLLPMCSPVAAHWLTLAPKGILRAKAGKPDLAAPASAKTDGKPNASRMSQADSTNTKLSLTVYIKAGIGDSSFSPICMKAQGVAFGMFARAGVYIDWRTGQPKEYWPEPPIVIEITSNTPESFRQGVLAYAYPFEGVHIRIFYDRLRNPDRPGANAMLLAHVMAHEITHILEGADRHSTEGLMKASWTPNDLVQMAYKPFPFDPEDVLLIRKGFAHREQTVKGASLGLIPATQPSE